MHQANPAAKKESYEEPIVRKEGSLQDITAGGTHKTPD